MNRPGQKAAETRLAEALYAEVAGLPLVCPHGHVDPRLLADPQATLGTPADLLIIPDHYLTRMLYSQGIGLERLGVPRRDGGWVESDPRAIWRLFCEQYYLFRGTPSALWLQQELTEIFGLSDRPSAATADRLYDALTEQLARPAFAPRALYERFNIDVLCTTDAATDTLAAHQALRDSGWPGRILPTFRPDALVHLETPGWRAGIDILSQVSGLDIPDYAAFLQALEQRRSHFRALGAVATDHAVVVPDTTLLTPREADRIFHRALHGQATPEDAARFSAHMLGEMARMSLEDGLVMQLHAGAWRNHNDPLYAVFGPDRGADIPVQTEFTRNLQPLLARYGSDPRLTLIVFTLDESAYARELAPLAGHYPALKLGPPWWFHDSPNGMARYFEAVMETAGLYNTAGFNDDTRAFCSIPARHAVWRRASTRWLAGLVAQHRLAEDEAREMAVDMAVGLARRAYHL